MRKRTIPLISRGMNIDRHVGHILSAETSINFITRINPHSRGAVKIKQSRKDVNTFRSSQCRRSDSRPGHATYNFYLTCNLPVRWDLKIRLLRSTTTIDVRLLQIFLATRVSRFAILCRRQHIKDTCELSHPHSSKRSWPLSIQATFCGTVHGSSCKSTLVRFAVSDPQSPLFLKVNVRLRYKLLSPYLDIKSHRDTWPDLLNSLPTSRARFGPFRRWKARFRLSIKIQGEIIVLL